MEFLIFAFVVCILVGLNSKATLCMTRYKLSTPSQKRLQLAWIWLVPVAGAIVTLAVHRPVEEPSRQYRNGPDPGDDFALSGRAHKSPAQAIDGD